MKFKSFVKDTSNAKLTLRIGDILNALHDLNANSGGFGTRHLMRNSEEIVNQIRRILHSNWRAADDSKLKTLQKVAVAIMKAIDEKGDVKLTNQSAAEELEKLVGKDGEPLNNFGAEDKMDKSSTEGKPLSPPQKKDKKPENAGSLPAPEPGVPSDGMPQMDPPQVPGNTQNI